MFKLSFETRRNWRRGIHGSRRLRCYPWQARSFFKFEGDLLVSPAECAQSLFDTTPPPASIASGDKLRKWGRFGQHTPAFLRHRLVSCELRSQDRGALRVWDLGTGACKAELRGHKGYVTAVDLEDGLAASAGEDGTVRIWDAASALATQRPLHADPEPQEHAAWDAVLGSDDDETGSDGSSAPLEGSTAGGLTGPGRRSYGRAPREAFELARVTVPRSPGGRREVRFVPADLVVRRHVPTAPSSASFSPSPHVWPRAFPKRAESLSLDAASGRLAVCTSACRVLVFDLGHIGKDDAGGGVALPETELRGPEWRPSNLSTLMMRVRENAQTRATDMCPSSVRTDHLLIRNCRPRVASVARPRARAK